MNEFYFMKQSLYTLQRVKWKNSRHEAVHGLSSKMYKHWIYYSESGPLFVKCLRVGNQKQVPNNSESDAHLYFFKA